jgi:hypothetical protein
MQFSNPHSFPMNTFANAPTQFAYPQQVHYPQQVGAFQPTWNPMVPQPYAQPQTQSNITVHVNKSRRMYTHTPYAFPESNVSVLPAAPKPTQPAPRPQTVTLPRPIAPEPLSTAVHIRAIRQDSFSENSVNSAELSPAIHDHTSEDDSVDSSENSLMQSVNVYSIQQCKGKAAAMSMTPHGSSFIQYALQKFPTDACAIFVPELLSAQNLARLLGDKNACYVVKALLSTMPKDKACNIIGFALIESNLALTLCTKDLHSRRMIQFFLELAGQMASMPLFNLLMSNPAAIVRTQQGCITAQRILDHVSKAEKEQFFAFVRSNFNSYAQDPFGHYIVEYMVAEGDQVENSAVMLHCWGGQFYAVSCHKNACTVIEKCFGLVTPELQHRIVEELFSVSQDALLSLLRNQHANYVIQAAIRTASHREIMLIHQRAFHLLATVPNGKKIQARLERRLAC